MKQQNPSEEVILTKKILSKELDRLKNIYKSALLNKDPNKAIRLFIVSKYLDRNGKFTPNEGSQDFVTRDGKKFKVPNTQALNIFVNDRLDKSPRFKAAYLTHLNNTINRHYKKCKTDPEKQSFLQNLVAANPQMHPAEKDMVTQFRQEQAQLNPNFSSLYDNACADHIKVKFDQAKDKSQFLTVMGSSAHPDQQRRFNIFAT